MRRVVRRWLPDREVIRGNRWLAPFQNSLLHPRLWHLNRRSAAGGVALGLFCGLVPGPFQMLSAALGALAFRVNLPLALILTLYTNPFTIVPLYLVAFEIGRWLLGADALFIAPPEMGDEGLRAWVAALAGWAGDLGRPLAIGLLALASLLAATGYAVTRAVWAAWLVREWRRRQRR